MPTKVKETAEKKSIYSLAETVAMGGLVKEAELKAAKSELKEGETENVDFKIHVKGAVSKGASSFTTVPGKALTKVNLGRALNKLNDETAKVVMEVMFNAIVDQSDVKWEGLELKPQVRAGLEQIFRTTEVPRSGSCSFKGTITPIEG